MNYSSQTFPVIFSWWVICSFPVAITYTKLNFLYSLHIFSNFFLIYVIVAACWKSYLSSLLIGFIIAIFVFHPIRRIYICYSMFQVYFNDIYNRTNELIKDKITNSHWTIIFDIRWFIIIPCCVCFKLIILSLTPNIAFLWAQEYSLMTCTNRNKCFLQAFSSLFLFLIPRGYLLLLEFFFFFFFPQNV